VKIAFFSSTPHGGGVALMRHALVRFSHSLGTDIKWYANHRLWALTTSNDHQLTAYC
jgi:hypothetical protein